MAGRLSRPPLIHIVTIGVLLATLTAVNCQSDDETLRKLKSKKLDELQAILSKVLETVNETAEVTTRDPRLTGDPRKDYVYDPNLPRELGAYSLSEYPFYNEVPKDINFTCSGKLDGYYASVPHHCQLFHLCVFGHRHDFLCANYTVFDQSQFICHFVNSVNCSNSEKHYDRNSELYVTTTTTTEAPFDDYEYEEEEEKPRRRRPQRRRKNGGRRGGKRRRTTTTTLSPDEYYYDYEDTATPHIDDEQLPTEAAPTTTTERIRRPVIRPPRPILKTTTADTVEAEAVDVVVTTERVQQAQRQNSRPNIEAPVENLKPAASTRSRIPATLPEEIEQNDQPPIPAARPPPIPAARPPPRRRQQRMTTSDSIAHDPMAFINPDAVVGGILSGAGAQSVLSPPTTTSTLRPSGRKTKAPANQESNDESRQQTHHDIIGGILSGHGTDPVTQPPRRRRPQSSRSSTNANPDEIAGESLSEVPAQPAAPSRQTPGRTRQSQAAQSPSESIDANNNRAGARKRLEVVTPKTGGSRNASPLAAPAPATSTAAGNGRIRVVQRRRRPVATTTTPQPPPLDQEYDYVE
ncbi:hypothetical protein CHUAL_011940 [Chamberlinius hualienensis]